MLNKVKVTLTVNGTRHEVTTNPDCTLLGVLLDDLKLTGTKYGCGRGDCGACTVYLDGQPAQACQWTLAELGAREVTTIEGLSPERAFAWYEAWAAAQLAPCSRCQSGLIMRAAHLLAHAARPTPAEIDQHLKPYDCHCGARERMGQVLEHAARALAACGA